MIGCETVFEINLCIWAIYDYSDSWVFGVVSQLNLCTMLFLFAAVAHDLVSQVRDPFSRPNTLKIYGFTLISVRLPRTISEMFTSCNPPNKRIPLDVVMLISEQMYSRHLSYSSGLPSLLFCLTTCCFCTSVSQPPSLLSDQLLDRFCSSRSSCSI